MFTESSSGEVPVDGSNKIFVGNLPFSASQQSVTKLFKPFGEVIGVNLRSDRATNRPKGFGFVTFSTAEAAQRAVDEMQGVECEGRELTVNFAEKRGEKASKKPAKPWTSWAGPEEDGDQEGTQWEDGW